MSRFAIPVARRRLAAARPLAGFVPAAAALLVAGALACAPAVPPAMPPDAVPSDSVPPAAEEAAVEPIAAEPAPPPLVELAPLWETVPRPADGFAALAVWPGAGQRPWLLVAAAATHRLVLFDAESGELLREVGALGERAGSFREPVDVAVAGDLAFVVERGNGRVQVLRLPGLATVGFLGEGELERPRAVAVTAAAGGGWTVWVAEEATAAADEPRDGPAEPSLRRYAVAADGTSGAGEVVTFGPPDRGLPLDVGFQIAGAGRYACPEGGGWLAAGEAGEILVLPAHGVVPAARLAVEGADALVAVAVVPPAFLALAAGTTYAVTDDSRVVAVGGAEVAAAVSPLLCR
jgi:hypothetical protein